MFAIEEGSEAFEMLASAFNSTNLRHRNRPTYKVSFAVHPSQTKVSIKINEGTWTTPLDVRKVG